MKKTLLNGEKIIYVATRLFNIQDKISGNMLEQKIYDILKKCATSNNETFFSYPLYLPFRDTNEDQLLECNDAFRVIYNADIKRLEKLYALITYLDDPSKDDGICMEIGYAYANSVPIILLSSDVQYYRIDENIVYHSDPIIHRMISEYVYMPEIPPSKYEVSVRCDIMEMIAQEYKERLILAENNILSKIVPIVEGLYCDYEKYIPIPIVSDIPHRTVFIDIMGGKYEWSREIQKCITSELDKYNINYYCSDRYFCHEDDVLIRGENDIKKLIASDVIVICVDGAETDAGAAALIGLAKKLNKTIILYYSSTCDIVEGTSSCKRNLMIELSANYICSSYKQVINQIINCV